MKFTTLFFLSLFLLLACGSQPDTSADDSTSEQQMINPPAEGFDLAGSDPAAIAIADSVMMAHGGRAAWDRARYFSFNFFGARHLIWDRYLGRVRITADNDSTILVYDDRTGTGMAKLEGEMVTDSAELAIVLLQTKAKMINDTYWLVFPFKLKDSGTTLTYEGEVEADPQAGRPSYVIDLTFTEVGNTPQNRYRVFVDRESHLINTWQYFAEASDEEPVIETPFDNYREIGGLMISDDRSGRFQLQEVEILDGVEEGVFSGI